MSDDAQGKLRTVEATRRVKGAAQEDEVYGALGALLGVLEVLATDDAVSETQLTRIRSAIGIGQRLQQLVEALLTLAADDLESRLRVRAAAVKPLVEHAVRGALRSVESQELTLVWPAAERWSHLRIAVDASRLDRALAAMVSALASTLGRGGALEVVVDEHAEGVRFALRGRHGTGARMVASPFESGLLEGAFRKLLASHGGSCALDLTSSTLTVTLPRAEGT
jgi:hypothetical protein